MNRRPPDPALLPRIYGLESYWRRRQTAHGFPAIEDRATLYREDGRLATWLRAVESYAPVPCRAVEIGCAPGALLSSLTERGYDCVGVEVDGGTADWLRRRTGLDVRAGIFPGVNLPRCGLFLAMDVLEHSYNPGLFLSAASELLEDGGTAIVQTAIDRYGGVPPFAERPDVFDDVEHLFVFSQDAMALLGEAAGLELVDSSLRTFLAGEICVYFKPVSPAARERGRTPW